MRYKGRCHCGRISFEAEGDLEKAMECNCSHCSRKGYLLWFVRRMNQFGKDRSGQNTAANNVRSLEDVDLSNLQKVAVDGRSI